MKTKSLTLVAIAAIAITATSCGSAKKAASAANVENQTEVVLPFSDAKYKSDEKMVREVTSGKSPDLATAKKIAMTNAITEMGVKIQNILKAVRDNYTNQRTVGDAREFENKFEELARIVVNQKLQNITTLDEKAFKGSDGVYQYWVAIEMPKTQIYEAVEKGISEDAKLNLNFDKHLFEKTFNEEMNKFNGK